MGRVSQQGVDPEHDPEGWAREHVHVTATPHGRTALRYLAQIRASGLVFEGRADGDVSPGHAAEKRAIDEAVAAYLDFVVRVRS